MTESEKDARTTFKGIERKFICGMIRTQNIRKLQEICDCLTKFKKKINNFKFKIR